MAQTITLPAQMDTDGASALQQSLLEALQSQSPLQLNASAVDRMNTPYVQLLAAVFGRASETKIINATVQFRSAWEDFGLTSSFPLEQ